MYLPVSGIKPRSTVFLSECVTHQDIEADKCTSENKKIQGNDLKEKVGE